MSTFNCKLQLNLSIGIGLLNIMSHLIFEVIELMYICCDFNYTIHKNLRMPNL